MQNATNDNNNCFDNLALESTTPESVNLSSKILLKINTVVDSYIEQNLLAGAITVIARHGKIAHFNAFGKKDIETGEEMSKDTIFRIYSMTKAITTTAALMLYDEGRYELNDPVSKFIPEFKNINSKKSMTIHDLMCHTSGLSYATHSDEETDLYEMIQSLSKTALSFEPGSKWCYGLSTDVLGYLIECWSGLSLDVFFKQRIFEPLKMIDTDFYVPQSKRHRFANIYQNSNEKEGLIPVAADFSIRFMARPSFLSGGGGLVSTALDYMQFLLMIQNGGEWNGQRFLQPQTTALMTQNQLNNNLMPISVESEQRAGVGFGLGFSVRVAKSDWDSAARIGEYGWGGMASTHFWVSPKYDLIVLTMEQTIPFSFLLESGIKQIVYDSILT